MIISNIRAQDSNSLLDGGASTTVSFAKTYDLGWESFYGGDVSDGGLHNTTA